MSRYRFELAGEADDGALRSVLAHTPMPGSISLAFGREPSYFAAAAVEGRFRQALMVRDAISGQVVGSGARSVTQRYVNGRPTPIGYLCNLRLLEGHRRGSLLARGYEFLHTLHQDGRTALYLTTIAEGNAAAMAALAAGRARLPGHHPAGRYYTAAIPLPRRRKGAEQEQRQKPLTPALSPEHRGEGENAEAFLRTSKGSGTNGPLQVRPATAEDAPDILAFLDRVGPRRQFFPCYGAGDLFAADGLLRGLQPRDLLLALRDGRVVGTLGAWDQQAFRQDVVHGYSAPLRWARPLYNGLAALRGLPRLPAPGQPLRCLMAALPLAADDDAEVLGALLRELRMRRSGGRWDYLLLGLHESDPLLKSLRPPGAIWYATRVYAVCWEDGEALRQSLDGRPWYLELGGL